MIRTKEIWLYARDHDHALEQLGGGSAEEFESCNDAERGFDPEIHQGWFLWRVMLEVKGEARGVQD